MFILINKQYPNIAQRRLLLCFDAVDDIIKSSGEQ